MKHRFIEAGYEPLSVILSASNDYSPLINRVFSLKTPNGIRISKHQKITFNGKIYFISGFQEIDSEVYLVINTDRRFRGDELEIPITSEYELHVEIPI